VDTLKLATWNVRGLATKEMELNNELKEQKINIAVITETKKKLKGTKDMGDYTMIYCGVDQKVRASAGVAILCDRKWKTKIKSYNYINERIVVAKFKVDRGDLVVIGVYAPEEGKPEEETKLLYGTLQELLNSNKNSSVILAGDMNARVGSLAIPGVVGTFGEQHINRNGNALRDFATFNNMKITNTFFRKKDIHKFTWSARGTRSLIDYVLVNEKLCNNVTDVRVYRGSDIGSDHFLVVAKLNLFAKWKNLSKKQERQPREEVFKVHLLQEQSVLWFYQQRLQQYLSEVPTSNNVDEEWNIIKSSIVKAASEALGRKRKSRNHRGLKVWNDEIAKAIADKKDAYKRALQQNTDESKQNYRSKRNIARAIIRRAHKESWEAFIRKVEEDLHGRQQVAYKIMKHLNKTEKDTARLNVVSKDRWIQHYKDLWFDGNFQDTPIEGTNLSRDEIDQAVDLITLEELERMLVKAKNRKATGPDGLNMELLKGGGLFFRLRFLHLINLCWSYLVIPEEWEIAVVKSLFKKGDRSSCDNYRGISLLNTAYKIYSMVIKGRMQPIMEVLLLEEQCGFRKGRACTDNVFVMKQIVEKRREFNLETHIAFVDFKKAFDSINRSKLWDVLQLSGYPSHLIKAVKSLYRNTRIIIDMETSKTDEIRINRGLRQGCGLSPALFNIYLDDMIRKWKSQIKTGIVIKEDSGDALNCLIFADDLIVLQESEDDLQRSLFELDKIGQDYNLIISSSKTRVMAFRGKDPVRSKIVVQQNIVDQVSHFHYLGCEISFQRDKDASNKMHRFQHICGTIHRALKNNATKETRIKFYKTMAAPTLLYGSETWVLSKRDESRLQASEMRFLRGTYGCSREDRYRNTDIRAQLNIFSIKDKISENRNGWFEHVNRMDSNRIPKQALSYKPIGRRDRGRPTRRWADYREVRNRQ
jgi:endonuclease/exonuclease/phosphatase family metal-dependent hydrolase